MLLLKTRSTPYDGYEEYFNRTQEGLSYAPAFVPVLEHKFLDDNLHLVKEYLVNKQIKKDGGKYGGMIFTSQRAVEAFARIVEEGKATNSSTWPHLTDVPIYTVGPATHRALSSIPQTPELKIYGAECGNGEALAHYMLPHYKNWHASSSSSSISQGNTHENPPILFLVGEQRRDIIPKTLMSPTLSQNSYIPVEELTVYGTGVMKSFPQQFRQILSDTESVAVRWVVVFSPTGCEAMLRELDMLDEATGKVKTGERGGGCGSRKGKRKTYIATIGPTTRDFLRKSFGFEPDVCAETPSPEGIGAAIARFMKGLAEES